MNRKHFFQRPVKNQYDQEPTIETICVSYGHGIEQFVNSYKGGVRAPWPSL